MNDMDRDQTAEASDKLLFVPILLLYLSERERSRIDWEEKEKGSISCLMCGKRERQGRI